MFRRTGRVLSVATITGATLAMALGATADAKSRAVKVDINDDGCPATLKLKAGPTTFKVTNSGSGDVSEFEILSGDRIIGEVENVAPGLNKEFSVTLKPGKYKTACPGGSEHAKGKLVVTGSAATKLSAAGQTADVDLQPGSIANGAVEL
jgi:iron uptake system component EfeO